MYTNNLVVDRFNMRRPTSIVSFIPSVVLLFLLVVIAINIKVNGDGGSASTSTSSDRNGIEHENLLLADEGKRVSISVDWVTVGSPNNNSTKKKTGKTKRNRRRKTMLVRNHLKPLKTMTMMKTISLLTCLTTLSWRLFRRQNSLLC